MSRGVERASAIFVLVEDFLVSGGKCPPPGGLRWEDEDDREAEYAVIRNIDRGSDGSAEVGGAPLPGDVRGGSVLPEPMRLVLIVEGDGLQEAEAEDVAERPRVRGGCSLQGSHEECSEW